MTCNETYERADISFLAHIRSISRKFLSPRFFTRELRTVQAISTSFTRGIIVKFNTDVTVKLIPKQTF